MSMYAALWRVLPGGRWLKVLQCVLLAAIVVLVLFQWVFPAISPLLPFDRVTVEGPGAAGAGMGAPGAGVPGAGAAAAGAGMGTSGVGAAGVGAAGVGAAGVGAAGLGVGG